MKKTVRLGICLVTCLVSMQSIAMGDALLDDPSSKSAKKWYCWAQFKQRVRHCKQHAQKRFSFLFGPDTRTEKQIAEAAHDHAYRFTRLR